MDPAADRLLRALCFYDVIGYAPTKIELLTKADIRSSPPFEGGDQRGGWSPVSVLRGRVVLAGREELVAEHERREALFPRKIRRARQVAGWLSRLGGVRFVAVCNTTALAHARDQGDLDFFVVTKTGALWQTRALAVLPFALLGRRPKPHQEQRDAVCLSFFVDDKALDLSVLQITDDIYFQYWFLDLLPLYDDGVSRDLWAANSSITSRFPLARPWIVNPDLSVTSKSYKLKAISSLEPLARRLQERAFSPAIKAAMNIDTRVVVNDHVLKFHVEDNRQMYRDAYRVKCRQYGIEP